jgi:gamma-glutamylputrescine oxidase
MNGSIDHRFFPKFPYLQKLRKKKPMSFSFWETVSFYAPADFAVIGSGIVGLHAALALRRARPEARIVVLEAGQIPAGASIKNAGFACFGSMTELMDDLSKGASEAEVFGLAQRRYRGLLRLRENLGDESLGYEPLGGYEIFTDRNAYGACADRLDEFNRLMKDTIGLEGVYREVEASTLKGFGFQGVCGAIWNRAEGQIHTGRAMTALVRLARAEGIEILNGFALRDWAESETDVLLRSHQGPSVRAAQVLFCTNGYTRQLLPELDVRPARNQVLITEEIPGLPFRGSFHYEEGYYYFRNVGNRILLGGGRHLDPETENTLEDALTDRIQKAQQELLESIVLPGRKATVVQRWTGILGLGERKKPIVRRIGPRMSVAVRMGGMGVAIGSLVGEEGARTVLGEIAGEDLSPYRTSR